MRNFLTILSFFLAPALLNAQGVNFKWVRTFGSPGYDVGGSLAVDGAGNVYATGRFSGTIDFDPGPAVYNLTAIDSTDVFVLKLDANGNLIWAKQLGGTGEQRGLAIVLDGAGNVYCSGTFENTVDFDPGPGIYNLSASAAAAAGFLCKLTAAGNFLWAVKFNESALYGLVVDGMNNVVAAGHFSGIVDFDPGPAVYNLTATGYLPPNQNQSDILVLKLDAAGQFVWAKQMGSNGQDFALSLDTDAFGNVYTTGHFEGLSDFDPGPGVYTLNTFGGLNFVSKLDAAGNFVWAKSYGGQTFNGVYNIKVDALGNVYTAGVVYSTADFDPGPGVFILNGNFSLGNGHIFISKLNTAGDFVWAKQVGGPQADFCTGLALDRDGNVYTTGGFTSPADFDPNAGVYSLTGVSDRDIFVLKLDSAGSFVWAKALPSRSNSSYGLQVFVDASKNVYTVGLFQSTTDFDPEPGVYNVTSAGSADIFIHKMSQCLRVTSATVTASACNGYTLNNQTYTSSGVYTQTLTNVFGCDSLLTLTLTIGGSTKTDTATACDSYNWQGQTLTTSGNYAVVLKSTDGCDSILKLHLTIKNKSFKTVDTAICEGQSYAGYTVSGTYVNTFPSANGCDSVRTLHLVVKARSYATVNASVCEGQSYLGHSTGGTYKDTLLNTAGCDSIRTLNLQVNPRKYSAKNVSICQGQSYTAGGASQTLSGVYKDTLVSTTGCDSIVTTNLTVYPRPVPNLGPDGDLCKGTTLVLLPGSFASFLWQNGSTAPSFTAADTGSYWVAVSDNNGCQGNDTVIIRRLLPLPQNFLKRADTLCQYDKLTLSAVQSFQTYLWSNGSRQPSITVSQPAAYTLTVTDNNGCTGKDTAFIFQKQCATGLFVPTAFTPNGDGKNDLFQPRLFGNVKSYRLRVYNRWGETVFQTADLLKGWDGKVAGGEQTSGVFVWTVDYQLEGEDRRSQKGTIVLLR